MASLLKKCSIKNALTRSYSAQSAIAVKPTHGLISQDPQVTLSTKNGIFVASLENNDPVSSIAILYKSGSRYESSNNLGVSYALRAFSGFATKNNSSFHVTRTFQQAGATFYCETGREHMLYGVSALKDSLRDCFKLFSDCATDHSFKQWEVDRVGDRMLYEKEAVDPSTILMDMLHRASYRNKGLGNSLIMPNYRAGDFSTQEVAAFMENTHTKGRMAVVGLGVDHTTLCNWVKRIDPYEGDGAADGLEASKYVGGMDIRDDTNGPLAYVAVAGAGAKLGSPEAASLAVAAAILGTDHGVVNLPRSVNRLTKFAKVVSGAGGSGHAVPININYSDSGLFGFMLVEEPSKAQEVTRAIVNAIKGLKVQDSDVKQAVVKVKSTVLINAENHETVIEEMGLQALFQRQCNSIGNLSALDNVTAASVQAAISTMLKSKASLVAYGGIRDVPYVDQL